ncbi:MAG: ferredoxin [Bacillota bacterium]
MIANYGYKDGSGDFFISIDTDKCIACEDKPCLEACPIKILEKFADDYDDEVVGVKEEHRKKIKYSCAECKPASGERNLACQKVCQPGAIEHSW